MDVLPIIVGVTAAAALVSALVAGLVLRAGPTRRMNRRLGIVLVVEGLLAVSILLDRLYNADGDNRLFDTASSGLILGFVAVYWAFLATFESPLVKPLRSKVVSYLLPALPVLGLIIGYAAWVPQAEASSGSDAAGALFGFLIGTVLVGGLVVAVSALRRAPKGSPARNRAAIFLGAFGFRDAAWLALIATSIIGETLYGMTVTGDLWSLVPPVITLAYVPVMAYGMVRHQLFDIDLKIKVGIRRSTVVTIMLLVALATAKTAEFYLNKTYGWIAGGIAAGMMLFLAPRLNKLGDKVANTAMPQVKDTSVYREFRKLEVYKAALEAAHEGGAPTPKERATLEALRMKLGVGEADAQSLEADLRPADPA